MSSDKPLLLDDDLEDLQDIMIRKMQNFVRRYFARKRLRNKVKATYVKLYDKAGDMYFYKNKTTGEISRKKPRFLGDEDLDPPRQFRAPQDYVPTSRPNEEAPEGWLFAIITKSFPRSDDKLQVLDEVNGKEMEELSGLFSHDFVCKFKTENMTILEDCSLNEIKEGFERMKRTCKKKHFLVLYICTHVVTVIKGEPKTNPTETAYFALKNTVWTKPEEIAKSALSLTTMCKMINRLPCRRKTVLINFAHMPEPKRPLFTPVKSLYPPADFLSRLADSANCAVIASCVNGVAMTEALAHTPPDAATMRGILKAEKEAKKAAKSKKNASGLSVKGEEVKTEKAVQGKEEGAEKGEGGEDTGKEGGGGGGGGGGAEEEDGEGEEVEEDEFGQAVVVSRAENDMEEFLAAMSGESESKQSNSWMSLFSLGKKRAANPTPVLVEKYLTQWQVKPDPEIVISKRPPLPLPVWKKDEETNFEFEIELPQPADYSRHFRETAYWRIKRTFGPPANFFREMYREHKKRNLRAPCQNNMIIPEQPYSIFGTALIDALNGGASSPGKRVVTAQSIYDYICKIMEDKVKLLQEAHTGKKAPPNQTPVLFVPAKNPKAGRNPICLRCGPPAAPDKPYLLRVDANAVLLEWYNPVFDGVPASKYRIEMRNKSRNFNEWQLIDQPGEIKTNRFLVRNLPFGVRCQFRIAAFNNGGWSRVSQPTDMVAPGEDLIPLQTQGRWKKLDFGGALATLDQLLRYPLHRSEHVIGLHKLIAYAQKDNGFAKGSLQLKAAAAAHHALVTFRDDVELARPAFMLLGWCLHGGPRKDTVLQFLSQHEQHEQIETIATTYMDKFRLDSGIINGVSWLRKGIATIPQPPEVVIPVLAEEVEEDDEEAERKAIEEDKLLAIEEEAKAKAEAERVERIAKEREEKRERLIKERADLAKQGL